APLILIIVWHVAFSFYVGDRGPVITYCLLCSSIYFYRFNRVRLTRAIVYLVAGSSIMVFVKDVRTKDTNTSYSERASVAINGVETNSKFDGLIIPGSTFIELAYSGRAVNHAIENVPGKYPFTYGYYLLFNTVAIVPGLAGIFWKLFSDSEAKYNSSSGFITYLIQGDNPLYGDGTSVVADLYLDFGVYGVIIGLFIFGKFVTKFEQQLYAGQVNSILLWIAALIFLSVAIYIGRSSISIQFQKIFLVFFFIKINSGISFYYAKKK
ncbi:MAG: O-antigen polysaccharide polymerase Wzy family protein, partial [Cyclobacteriaceae bacterium]|nr:O-antigen polysaccharide polymerase Wzy family protein [Cyclobacteriaceae bacterium]